MKKTLIAVATALTLSTSAALAADQAGKLYVAGQLGYGAVQGTPNTNVVAAGNNVAQSANGLTKLAAAGSVGYLMPTSNAAVSFGPELSFIHFSSQTIQNSTTKASVGTLRTEAFALSGVLKIAPAHWNNYYLAGKAGIAYVTQTGHIDASTGDAQANNYSPLLATAVGYDTGSEWGYNLTYQYLAGVNSNNATQGTSSNNTPAYAVLAGVTYTFA
jgi:hypothetical protein